MSFRAVQFSLVIAALAGLTAIQPVSGQTQPATDPTQPADPTLKGPAINDHSTPKGSTQAGFGPDSIEKKKNAKHPARPVPMAAFLKSLDVLRSSPTPEATQLTSDQDAKIQAAATAFDTSSKQYLAANQTEIDSLRAQLSPSDRAMLDEQLQRGGPIKLSKAGFGGKNAALKHKQAATDTSSTAPSTDPSTTTGTSTSTTNEAAAKARARLVEIYAGRPKAQDTQDKILGLLTPDQLAIENDQLAKLEAAHAKRAGAAHAKKAG